MEFTSLIGFALAFFIFAASPGPDNMTILARSLHHGAASGLAYGLGTVTGILIFLSLAAFGLSAFASEMGWAMVVLRYLGAIYLIWMGCRLWTAPAAVPEARHVAGHGELWRGYLAGVFLNLGNPKMPLFYIALLPNVVDAHLSLGDFSLLAAAILIVEALVIGGHILLALRTRGLLRNPVVLRRLNRGAGALMVGAGATVIVAR
ncbi:LysE family translocator [Rhizobium rhizoryzae]|uniref:Threonine/homoserine/homoserine lactone efflux protein n=1 Tax=Rhizobium rhizoryzae TaxID=451876 RepID=A0A7W6PQG3_9HYPH|nr:LysE family translocator [Rhizobium rhizoryzae]MBB4141660.1 threonine/homoserine/homoserine lactone efflux protein [Rhizobium rhizoryzae]